MQHLIPISVELATSLLVGRRYQTLSWKGGVTLWWYGTVPLVGLGAEKTQTYFFIQNTNLSKKILVNHWAYTQKECRIQLDS